MPSIKILIYGILGCFGLTSAYAQVETAQQLMQTVKASLVEVRTVDTRTIDDGNGHSRSASYHTQGSGVIIGSDGIIVTNTHIVAHAPKIYVGLSDGTVLEARIVYSSDADFSFLKIDPPAPLSVISWADSSLAPVGTPIIALTNSGDDQERILGGSITGLINSISSNTVELFELNLDLVHGDSGGPLLDSQGNLLGLITARKDSEAGKSYAIASNKIQQEYQQYRQNPPNN